MNLKTIKTKKITEQDKDIFKILDESVTNLSEKSVLVITSKIISICEGSIVKIDPSWTDEEKKQKKEELIKQESQYYLPGELNTYGVSLTITRDRLVPMAGIDESNSNDHFVLWPKDPYKSANEIRKYLRNKFKIKDFGVIISDSTVSMLQWGTLGTSIAYSGFKPLRNYIGKNDLFGRPSKFTTANLQSGIASAAVFAMGEGDEQTPICLIEELESIEFVEDDPTKEEIDSLKIRKEDDLYGYVLGGVKWEVGQKTVAPVF